MDSKEKNNEKTHKETKQLEENANKDKLEILFSKQKSLFTEELDKQQSNPKQEHTTRIETKLAGTIIPNSKTTQRQNKNSTQNKMRYLYKIPEPFLGYRIFMLSSALLHEAVELQRETNWKWWKETKDLNKGKIEEEVIDLWHFLIQISIEVGLDPDKIVQKYIEKNKENLERQKRGY